MPNSIDCYPRRGGTQNPLSASESGSTTCNPMALPAPNEAQEGVTADPPRRTDIDFFEQQPESCGSGVKRFAIDGWKSLCKWRLFLGLTWIQIRERKGTYALSCCSTCFTVTVCVLMLSILFALPFVFLKLGENTDGLADLVLQPGGQIAKASSLSYSAITEAVSSLDSQYRQMTPRIVFSLTAVSESVSCPTLPSDNPWMSEWGGICGGSTGCLSNYCNTTSGPKVQVTAIDFEQEEKIGMGADFGYNPPGVGEIILSTKVATQLGVSSGDVVFLWGDVDTPLRQLFQSAQASSTSIIISARIAGVCGSFGTKFPASSSFAVIDYRQTSKVVASGISPVYSQQAARVAAVNPDEYVSSVYFRIPTKRRTSIYVSSSYAHILSEFSSWAGVIITKIGYNQLDANAPLINFLDTVKYFTSFIGLIVSIIILALGFMSLVIIHSLLTLDVETRTYEMGLQRMIGFSKGNLVILLFVNVYAFAIPAWILGMAGGQAAYSVLRSQVFEPKLEIPLQPLVSGTSLGWSTLVGLGLPLAATIFPLLSVLALNLPDALNSTRSRNSGVIYSIKRNDGSSLSWSMLGLGLLMAIFGFLIYVMLPLSLIKMNLSELFTIFFAVLVGMLAGLVLLASNFQRVIETGVAYLFCFWEAGGVFDSVLKNLAAHRQRNQKTTLMYSLALAFILFITVAFQVQLQSMVYGAERNVGADMLITFSYTKQYPSPGDYSMRISTYNGGFYLDNFAEMRRSVAPLLSDGSIQKMGYRTYSMKSFNWMVSDAQLETMGRFQTSPSQVTAISPNYYEVVSKRFLKVHRMASTVGQYGLSGALYAAKGFHKLIVATTTYRTFALDMDSSAVEAVTFNTGSPSEQPVVRRTLLQPDAALDSSPQLLMTKFPNNMGALLSSMPALSHMQYNTMSCYVLPIQYVVISMKGDSKVVEASLRTFFNSKSISASISTAESATSDFVEAQSILNTFFVLAEVMILLICFFSLLSSMTANVMNSSKEIGILLCLGMTNFQVYRLFVWEAFILLVSAALLGLAVGMVVAYTLQMQNVLFSQLPLPFVFPYQQLLITIVMGFVSAVATSVAPVAYLLGLPSVNHILRRQL